jgi:hypothetical protein
MATRVWGLLTELREKQPMQQQEELVRPKLPLYEDNKAQ